MSDTDSKLVNSESLFQADTQNDSVSDDDVSIDVNAIGQDQNENESIMIDKFILDKVIHLIYSLASKDFKTSFGFIITIGDRRVVPIDNHFRRSPSGFTDISALLGTAYRWDDYMEFLRDNLKTYSYAAIRSVLVEIQLNMVDWSSSPYPQMAEIIIKHIDFMINYKLLSSLKKS